MRYAAAVARRTGMEALELAALIDRLEKRGHVERMPNTGDRKSTLLRETEQGLF